jgi:hypothetical protein
MNHLKEHIDGLPQLSSQLNSHLTMKSLRFALSWVEADRFFYCSRHSTSDMRQAQVFLTRFEATKAASNFTLHEILVTVLEDEKYTRGHFAGRMMNGGTFKAAPQ